jgi:hypothetical protein
MMMTCKTKMKRSSLMLPLLIIACTVCAQQKPVTPVVKPEIPDTIVKMGGRKVAVLKMQKGSSSTTYVLQSKPDSMIRIENKDIETILYRNGNRLSVNKPVVDMVKDDQWQAVLITRNKSEIEGMYSHGFVRAKNSMNPRSRKHAEETATVNLQKQGTKFKAYIILVTNEFSTGGYNDIPGYQMEGIAYGFEPLEKGTNVITDKGNNQKTDAQKQSTSGTATTTKTTDPKQSTTPAATTTTKPADQKK